MTNIDTKKWAVPAAFVAIYLIWGSTYGAITVAIATMPPLLMAGARFTLAGALLYGCLRWRGAEAGTTEQWRAAAVMGAALLLVGNGVVVFAEQHVASGFVALLATTVPMWTTLFDWLLFDGERPGAMTALGLGLGAAAMVLLVGAVPLDEEATWATAALLVSAMVWALGSLYARRAPRHASALASAGQQMIAGGLMLTVTGLLFGELPAVDVTRFSGASLLAFAYLVVFGAIVALGAYVTLLTRVPAAAVATHAFVNPIVAVGIGWALLGEQVVGRQLLAAPLVVLAVVLVVLGSSKRSPREVTALIVGWRRRE